MLAFRGFAREQLWKALPRPSLRELLRALGLISALHPGCAHQPVCLQSTIEPDGQRPKDLLADSTVHAAKSAQKQLCEAIVSQVWAGARAEIYLVLKEFVFNLFSMQRFAEYACSFLSACWKRECVLTYTPWPLYTPAQHNQSPLWTKQIYSSLAWGRLYPHNRDVSKTSPGHWQNYLLWLIDPGWLSTF